MEIQVLPEPNYPVSPDQFIGRKNHSEAFTLAVRQGLAAGRISSFAVLGDWGIGKSSLLLKFAAISSGPKYDILPVLVPVSKDYGDYRRFAESLLDGLAEALPESPTHLWPHVFQQMERNKFRLDLAHVPERELQLVQTLAGAQRDEINPRHFIPAFQYAHFARLTEKGLLIRTGRGRYKLYHPLFREFLRQTK